MTPAQCRAARGLLDWSQVKLAEAASLSVSTVVDFERRRRKISDNAVAALQHALEAGGVEFLGDGRPGVRHKTVA